MLNIKEICVVLLILGLYSTTVKAGEFDLAGGKQLLKGILGTIHSKLQDGQDDDDTIDAATSLSDLLQKANNAVSTDDLNSLKDLSTNARKDFRSKLDTFNTNFTAKLNASGDGDKTVPFAYLLSQIHA